MRIDKLFYRLQKVRASGRGRERPTFNAQGGSRARGRPRPRKGGQTTGWGRLFKSLPRVSLTCAFASRTGPSAPPVAPLTPHTPLARPPVADRLRGCC